MTRKAWAMGAGMLMLAIALSVGGCASNVDDPSQSDSVVRIDSITPSSVHATTTVADDSVVAVVSATSRGGAKGSTLNDVVLDNYTVFYDPPLNGTVPALNFAITLVVKSGGTATLSAIAVPAGMKPLIPTAVINATLEVEGRDTLGNPTSASSRFTIFPN